MYVSRSSTRRVRIDSPSRRIPIGASSLRAQTEPLAALAAIAAVGVAFALYAGVFAGVLPAQSERRIEDATLERVWHEVEKGGVIETGNGDLDDELRFVIDEIDPRIVPDGYAVRVTITGVDEGGNPATNSRVIDRSGVRSGSTDVPDRARSGSRPIAVQRAPGDVRGGRLRVEVWS